MVKVVRRWQTGGWRSDHADQMLMKAVEWRTAPTSASATLGILFGRLIRECRRGVAELQHLPLASAGEFINAEILHSR